MNPTEIEEVIGFPYSLILSLAETEEGLNCLLSLAIHNAEQRGMNQIINNTNHNLRTMMYAGYNETSIAN